MKLVTSAVAVACLLVTSAAFAAPTYADGQAHPLEHMNISSPSHIELSGQKIKLRFLGNLPDEPALAIHGNDMSYDDAGVLTVKGNFTIRTRKNQVVTECTVEDGIAKITIK